MKKRVAVMAGDGIGSEITAQAVRVLNTIGDLFGHTFAWIPLWIGGASYDRYGTPLTEETVRIAKDCDAILLGSVGGPTWERLPSQLRPENGLLTLRKSLGLFANLRPIRLYPALVHACPLQQTRVEDGLDLLIVRELTGGLYFGERFTREINGVKTAVDTMQYTADEIERILHVGFAIAQKRRKKLTSVDKANVLDTSRLWRIVANRVAQEYPEVLCEHMLVDNAAMQLVRNPGQFDVIVTENMFGDILSDEASVLAASIGMMPSASLREDTLGLFEPSHGSAPDLAGCDRANPIAAILSAAMLLRYSFDLHQEAGCVEKAVEAVLDCQLRTDDLFTQGCKRVSCSEMGDAILEQIQLSAKGA